MNRILVDLDGITVDLLTPWVEWINATYGRRHTVADVTEWDLHKALELDESVYDFIDKGLEFERLEPVPGAIEALRNLNEVCEVVIVTAQSKNPHSAAHKLEWCGKHLPFLGRKEIIIAHRKELIAGDLLIDDSPHNAAKFPGPVWSIRYPYNENAGTHSRLFGNWDAPRTAWSQMVAAILRQS